MPNVTSTMAGTIIEVTVNVGDQVEAGQDVACLESMKMQMYLQAETSGKVKAVKVNAGDFVNEGDVVLELE
ncbi:MAG TPA: acetyl-CoA carboxylase biotin carboxyl carrier protein subunit [Stenomitos sp.]